MAVRTIDETDLVNKKVSQLPERPTDPVGDGGAGMTSRAMRERFDAYPEVIRTFFNKLVSSIYADPDADEDALANLMLLAAEDENGQPGSLSATIAALRENVSSLRESLDSLDQTKFAKGDGIDSFTNKTTDPERANTVRGNYSGAFGSRNLIGEKASEALAVGGLIEHYGQNGLSVGYRVEVRANQSITGGYRVVNKASESIQVGSYLSIDGTLSEDEDGNPKSDSRYIAQFGTHNEIGTYARGCIQAGDSLVQGDSCQNNAQFGKSNSMGDGTKFCFMSGEGITQDDNCQWDDVSGKGHQIGDELKYSRIGGQSNTIGNGCSWIDVFGDYNTIGNFVKESTVRGFDNTITPGTASDKTTGVYIFGNNCSNNYYKNVCMIGEGLYPSSKGQILVGKWNDWGFSSSTFLIGCGSSSTSRDMAFTAGKNGSRKFISIGNTFLYEDDLQSLLALLN